MKLSILNICLFWFTKYIVFYVVHMFKTGNDYLLQFHHLKSGGDCFYYFYLFLFMPVLCMLVFTMPLRLLLKYEKRNIQLLILLSVLVLEYFLYTYLASSTDLWNGIYNGLIGVFLFMVFFYKQLFHLNKV